MNITWDKISSSWAVDGKAYQQHLLGEPSRMKQKASSVKVSFVCSNWGKRGKSNTEVKWAFNGAGDRHRDYKGVWG